MNYQDYQEMNKRMDMVIAQSHDYDQIVEANKVKAMAAIAYGLGQMLSETNRCIRNIDDISVHIVKMASDLRTLLIDVPVGTEETARDDQLDC